MGGVGWGGRRACSAAPVSSPTLSPSGPTLFRSQLNKVEISRLSRRLAGVSRRRRRSRWRGRFLTAVHALVHAPAFSDHPPPAQQQRCVALCCAALCCVQCRIIGAASRTSAMSSWCSGLPRSQNPALALRNPSPPERLPPHFADFYSLGHNFLRLCFKVFNPPVRKRK